MNETSIEVPRATIPCGSCGAQVTELRRGRCWGCYTKWAELRPVGRGAACAVCHERRRDHLRMIELHGRSAVLCHGCAGRTLRLPAVPETLEGLRGALSRDRRRRERRGGGIDRRIFPRERRADDRRGPLRPREPAPDFAFALDDLEIELDWADVEEMELTIVRETPAR